MNYMSYVLTSKYYKYMEVTIKIKREKSRRKKMKDETNIYTYTHTHIHIYTHIYIYIHIYTYIHTYTYTQGISMRLVYNLQHAKTAFVPFTGSEAPDQPGHSWESVQVICCQNTETILHKVLVDRVDHDQTVGTQAYLGLQSSDIS